MNKKQMIIILSVALLVYIVMVFLGISVVVSILVGIACGAGAACALIAWSRGEKTNDVVAEVIQQAVTHIKSFIHGNKREKR